MDLEGERACAFFAVRGACMHSRKISYVIFGLKTATSIGLTVFDLECALACFLLLLKIVHQTAQLEVHIPKIGCLSSLSVAQRSM